MGRVRRTDRYGKGHTVETTALRAARLPLPPLIRPGQNSDQDQRHRAEERPGSLDKEA